MSDTLGPRFLQTAVLDAAALRRELQAGLLAEQAHTSPKFLYDALGSKLFEAITELPEYYPTRTEAALMKRHAPAIAAVLPRQATLIDLGAGNCAKAAAHFADWAPARYVAVDISVDFLRQALECLQRQHPALELWGVGLDFSAGLHLPPEVEAVARGPRLLFYPGSSIGNFTPPEALAFLRTVHSACAGGGDAPTESGLLIGVDLVKRTEVLEAAYDDALGVTAAFNRNVLLNLNRCLGSDFAVRDWRHVARYDRELQRIEMHLEALRDLEVVWPDAERGERTTPLPAGSPDAQRRSRRFRAGETLHTENSCKWTIPGFEALLRDAGFDPRAVWTDEAQAFGVFWATVRNPAGMSVRSGTKKLR